MDADFSAQRCIVCGNLAARVPTEARPRAGLRHSWMPNAAPRPCPHPGCGRLVRDGKTYCATHRAQRQQQQDAKRGTAHERGYSSRWRKARETYLRSHPVCRLCEAKGIVRAASVVDHIVPHRGDQALFWDSAGNWQSLCVPCHSAKTVREDGGFGRPVLE